MLIGHARQAGSGPNPARQVGRRAGLPDEVPAQTINQACASGLQTVALGAQAILTGQSNIVLAGGIESMSRMPYFVDSDDARWGHKMGNFAFVDAMYRDGFFCPLSQPADGADRRGAGARSTASPARRRMPTRSRASSARRGRDRCRPLRGRDHAGAGARRKGKAVELAADEHPRAGTTIEWLRKLPLVFEPVDGQAGIITAGTSSGITDGGAAVVLASEDEAARPRPHAAGVASSAGRRPASIRASWGSARCRRCASCWRAPGSRSTTSTSSS